MFDSIKSAWKLNDLRRKVLFTLLMFLVFRVGAHVPVPGINHAVLQQLLSGQFFGFFDIISGGAFKSFTVFAMSITPYVNASIIFSLLQVVIPSLEKLAKEGESGRKIITQYTRYGTVVLGFVQAIGMSIALGRGTAATNGVPAIEHPGIGSYLLIAITLTVGTAFLMWLGEMITEKGIGNGISLIIFAGIVSRLPAGAVNTFTALQAGSISWFNVLLLTVLGLLVIAAVVAVNEGQRRIPVQYAKRVVGRKVYGGQSTHIPLRVNQAGVIPIIFAMSILMFPVQIAQWINSPDRQKHRHSAPVRDSAERRVIRPADHLLHLLLYRNHLQPDGRGRQFEEVRRFRAWAAPWPADRRVHQPGVDQADPVRRHLPGADRSAAVPDDPHRQHAQPVFRGHRPADRGGRGAGDDEAVRVAPADAALPGFHEIGPAWLIWRM